MPAGSRGSDRSTASPRKTCVPGVHANAGVGNNATTTRAIAMAPATGNAALRQPDGPRVTLYAEPLALASDGFAQISKLRLHHVGHRLARCFHCVSNLLANRVDGNAIP